MTQPTPSDTNPRPKLTGLQRLIAAASFSFTVAAALLLWWTYQSRDEGVTVANILRCLGAGACFFLAVHGTKLRHR